MCRRLLSTKFREDNALDRELWILTYHYRCNNCLHLNRRQNSNYLRKYTQSYIRQELYEFRHHIRIYKICEASPHVQKQLRHSRNKNCTQIFTSIQFQWVRIWITHSVPSNDILWHTYRCVRQCRGCLNYLMYCRSVNPFQVRLDNERPALLKFNKRFCMIFILFIMLSSMWRKFEF